MKLNSGSPQDVLCAEFKHGLGPHAGYTCANLGTEAPADADYFLRSRGVATEGRDVPYYGAISPRVDRVVLRLADGTEIEGSILGPPSELAVHYKFFVGFAPAGSDVMVVVEDESGRELDRELWTD